MKHLPKSGLREFISWTEAYLACTVGVRMFIAAATRPAFPLPGLQGVFQWQDGNGIFKPALGKWVWANTT